MRNQIARLKHVFAVRRVAGKQVLRRPTLFIDAVKKFDLRAFSECIGECTCEDNGQCYGEAGGAEAFQFAGRDRGPGGIRVQGPVDGLGHGAVAGFAQVHSVDRERGLGFLVAC